MTTTRRTVALLINSVVGDYQSELRAGVERAAEAHDVNRAAGPRRWCMAQAAKRASSGRAGSRRASIRRPARSSTRGVSSSRVPCSPRWCAARYTLTVGERPAS
ncbi:hypothetical protein WME99_02505 [Sorangium sp. So ce136]|uniref:hypothetical protein n=1 Tax=Sorangium sp. So ce136 TaxID=3133284 RepID=UPI003F00493D